MKKSLKKLVLAKETVRDLSQQELNVAEGGSQLFDTMKYCLNHPASWTC